ncbi:ribbon-helix-helix protein, CopG family [Calothrix sp. PCC 7507]|uniref:ribbon-helix-helix protein, CopG family n=1 Tax=Calothrix sp. PCC 7507 TaxID=99598 RepID=UPI00029F2C9D|nr:ribbon-helix-helix protein, CopG family [Calothrix sp. PCC 7507]AFY35916.1 hypothetical protein Cal7507_5590 [Calothrix sp. PCC 7507]
MLSVRLDEETKSQLADILAHEQTDKSELIRRLIAERWLTLQAGKTFHLIVVLNLAESAK